MFDLCKILGVEEGEVFKLNGCDYQITDNKMWTRDTSYKPDSCIFKKCDYPLNLLAEAELERLPFVPKLGQAYWTAIYADSHFSVCRCTNGRNRTDLWAVKLGIAFRTEREAEEKGIPLLKEWKEEMGW